MKTYSFKVVVEEDEFEDGKRAYHASCPALKGCHTWGYTQEEALKNIQEAVATYLESLLKHQEPIPADVVSDEALVSVTVPT